jgi:hypothetical protein
MTHLDSPLRTCEQSNPGLAQKEMWGKEKLSRHGDGNDLYSVLIEGIDGHEGKSPRVRDLTVR